MFSHKERTPKRERFHSTEDERFDHYFQETPLFASDEDDLMFAWKPTVFVGQWTRTIGNPIHMSAEGLPDIARDLEADLHHPIPGGSLLPNRFREPLPPLDVTPKKGGGKHRRATLVGSARGSSAPYSPRNVSPLHRGRSSSSSIPPRTEPDFTSLFKNMDQPIPDDVDQKKLMEWKDVAQEMKGVVDRALDKRKKEKRRSELDSNGIQKVRALNAQPLPEKGEGEGDEKEKEKEREERGPKKKSVLKVTPNMLTLWKSVGRELAAGAFKHTISAWREGLEQVISYNIIAPRMAKSYAEAGTQLMDNPNYQAKLTEKERVEFESWMKKLDALIPKKQ